MQTKRLNLDTYQIQVLGEMCYEGYELSISWGDIWFIDEDCRDSEFPVQATEIFLKHTCKENRLDDTSKEVDRIGSELQEWAYEHYCPECGYMRDLDDLIQTDDWTKMYSTQPSQICTECLEAEYEANADPYALRGLHRSEFY